MLIPIQGAEPCEGIVNSGLSKSLEFLGQNMIKPVKRASTHEPVADFQWVSVSVLEWSEGSSVKLYRG